MNKDRNTLYDENCTENEIEDKISNDINSYTHTTIKEIDNQKECNTIKDED